MIVDAEAPAHVTTDRKRLTQVIRNLMSNAVKFTEVGGITVEFGCPAADVDLSRSGLESTSTLAIAVQDTGVGIPLAEQKAVFEAFQQVEGGDTRKYAGTGLGLSISRELAQLLGGEIQLRSQVGEGSTFALYLPTGSADGTGTGGTPRRAEAELEGNGDPSPPLEPALEVEAIADDRDDLEPGDHAVLVVEDDVAFARILQTQCHDRNLKCLAATTGEEGLRLAQAHLPHAVILDLRLPGMDGWRVLEALKENPATRHIPVHIMSVDEASIEAMQKGAIGFLTKPVQREDLHAVFDRFEEMLGKEVKDLLVVEDDVSLRGAIIQLVGNGDVHTGQVGTGREAIEALRTGKYDCVVMDLGLPDMTGFDLLQALEGEQVAMPPVVVYTGRALTREEEMELRTHAESIIIKGARSDERLLDEVSLFLHREVEKMPEQRRQIITDLHDTDRQLRDKRVLIVDDDMRSLFALSQILEQKGMKVSKAEGGDKALSLLAEDPGMDLVLMDVMMPGMDGHETMRRIREQGQFGDLPIIALTAKAMREDREQCLAAGANDYLSKPVDVTRLSSLMRVWLYR